MKKYIIIIFTLLLNVSMWSQVLSVASGTVFHVPENTNLVLSGVTGLNIDSENTSFNGNVKFISTEEQLISGSVSVEIANLYVDNNGLVLDNNLTVNSELDLQSGIVNLQANKLTLSNNVNLIGNFADDCMIVKNTNGIFQRNVSGNGTFLFPVGDIDGVAEYSPVELEMLEGLYTDANISVSVYNSKYTQNNSTTNYLNRYWEVSSSGISNPNYDISLTYVSSDVSGNESNIYGAYYTDKWNLLDLVSGNMIEANLNEFGTFTGGEQSSFVGVMDVVESDIDVVGLEDAIKITAESNIEIQLVEVFNVLGKKIYELKDFNSNIINFHSNVQTAVYFVRVQTNKGTVSEKVLIY